ncbi:MAG: hypothetical protein PVF28_05345 [Thioalkalispiraceae bacterium]
MNQAPGKSNDPNRPIHSHSMMRLLLEVWQISKLGITWEKYG